MPTNPRPDDPAEGSPEVIDRQLKRSEEKKRSSGGDGEPRQQREGGKQGEPGSEEAGGD